MKIMSAEEAKKLLKEYESANVRDFIAVDTDGEEKIDINRPGLENKTRFIKKVLMNQNGELVEIELTNGQKARNDSVVYLLRAGNGLVKIGYTYKLAKRMSALRTASPVEIEIIGLIKTATAELIERRLHEVFTDKRVRGEWFALTDDDIQKILSGEVTKDIT